MVAGKWVLRPAGVLPEPIRFLLPHPASCWVWTLQESRWNSSLPGTAGKGCILSAIRASRAALSGKEPVCQCWRDIEIWVQSLSREDALKEEMTIHSSILAWKIPWTRSLAGYSPWGHRESDMTKHAHTGKSLEIFWSSHLFMVSHHITNTLNVGAQISWPFHTMTYFYLTCNITLRPCCMTNSLRLVH